MILFLTQPGRLVRLLILAAAVFGGARLAAKIDWDPVPASDLAATDCALFPGAGAEMIFSRQAMEASGASEWMTYYRRVKIYQPKAAEEQGVMDIEYPASQRAWDLAARVIKPDGRIAEYGKKDFNESVAAKTRDFKVKRSTLAIPALEKGDVVEFQWATGIESEDFNYSWWYSQLKMPVRDFYFRVAGSRRDCRLLWFNSRNESDRAKGDGIQLHMKNVLPFEEEPFSPPERDIRSWFLVLYTSYGLRWYKSNDLWREFSSELADEFRLLTKPDGTLKAKAAEVIGDATSNESKLQRLYEFTQRHVTNLDYFDSDKLQDAKKRLDKDDDRQTPRETLTRATGRTRHVNELFAALARAVGFEVTQARSATRGIILQVRNDNGWLFLRDQVVAVKVGEHWQKYAPGDYFVPVGLVDPSNEGASSLLCQRDKVIWEDMPVANATSSHLKRQGRFTLDAEGNLEGEVVITRDGHVASESRRSYHGDQTETIDTEYTESITRRLPSAELTDLKWENFGDNREPLITRYKLRVPAYADMVGTKLILPTNVFQHNVPAAFSAAERKFPIIFPYAFMEEDDIEIVLPEGFELDAPSSPANVADIANVAGTTYAMKYSPKTRTLGYRRTYTLGQEGRLSFQSQAYALIKSAFDKMKRSDDHKIVLKEKVPTAAGASGR